MIPNHRILVLLLATFTLPLITAAISSTCRNQTCGGKSIQYPFGFSDGCPIRLNCSEREGIFIDEFQVLNVTQNGLMIDVPPSCNRPIESLKHLFGENYALTWNNSFLFKNCSSQVSGCVIPAALVQNHIDLKDCNPKSENLSCYVEKKGQQGLISYANVSQSHCRFLFSSVVVDSNKNSAVSLEFQRIQLAWWLEGPCVCSKNADSVNMSAFNGRSRCSCRCSEGFEGDGFKDGSGCRKASSGCGPLNYVSGRCRRTTRVGVLIGGIIAGASLMFLLALLCYFIRRQSNSRKARMSTKRLQAEATANCCVPFYPYKEIERATDGFSERQRLGTGAYGTVYAGKLHNDKWVAIKRIRHRDNDGIEQVMNEIKLLSSVSHPNLVRLLGCCLERGEQILVYEFMPNGTLSEHLQRERGTGLPWTIRLTIATETAQAISHLHSTINPPIYHRDIKSSNILLDYNFNSKVADFGLSRLGMTESSHISTAPQGTPGYLDPQYHQSFHLSDKSDVYSFGVVLVEIITALKVVDFSRPHSEVNLAALAIDKIGRGCVDEIIDPFLEPHRDAWTLSSVHKVAELAFRCLAFHRDMRPSMMEVAAELEQVRRSGWAPLEENICMDSSAASSCSFPSIGSEKPLGLIVKKAGVGSQKLLVPQRGADCLISTVSVKDSSPVSVQDPWLSEQSSPSTNSLLDNVIQ